MELLEDGLLALDQDACSSLENEVEITYARL
jgi:hypothetical protein